MKGKGVRNLQHEYTAKTPLSYCFIKMSNKQTSFCCSRLKQKHHIEKRMKQITKRADNHSTCYACLNITDKHKCLYNTVT